MSDKIIPQDKIKELKEMADTRFATCGYNPELTKFVFTLIDAAFAVGEYSEMEKSISKLKKNLGA